MFFGKSKCFEKCDISITLSPKMKAYCGLWLNVTKTCLCIKFRKTNIFRDSNEHELVQNVAKSERNTWEVGLLRAELGSEYISKKYENMEKVINKNIIFFIILLFFVVFLCFENYYQAFCNTSQVSIQRNQCYGILKYRSVKMCLLCRSFNTTHSEKLLEIAN